MASTETLTGTNFGASQSGGAYVHLFVADGSDVLVFADGATGNTAPMRVLAGAKTGVSEAFNLAVHPDGTIYLADADEGLANGRITVYSPGAAGNTPPLRTITGLPAVPWGGLAIDKAVHPKPPSPSSRWRRTCPTVSAARRSGRRRWN
jgi:hypothetical protein